ncbi:site-specific integrase [Vibrio alginolyticus]|nr:site-specific integrase [Vibrio alginolyticus]
MSYEYQNLTDGLAIYKQKASKNYYIYLNTSEGNFRRSLKTPDQKEATKKAWAYYTSYHDGIELADFTSTNKSSVEYLCKQLSEIFDEKHADTEKKDSKYRDFSRILSDEISPNLGHLKIKQVERGHIKSILSNANSLPQLRIRQTAFKHLFDYALENSLIKEFKIPSIPKVEVKESESRAIFKPEHLSLFREKHEEFTNAPTKAVSRLYRELMGYAMDFMLETGIRPGNELYNLKFSDITKARSQRQIYYHIKITAGKIHGKKKSSSREVPLSDRARDIILEIANKYYCKTEQSSLKQIKFDAYIFKDPKNQKKSFDGKTFNQLCTFCHVDQEAEFYTLYSCRHSYITRKLIEGVDIYLLATTCGTSVEMIQKYYSKLVPTMRVDELI